MDVARRAVRLARAAAGEAGRGNDVAVAFSINGDVDTPDGRETIRLLARAFEQDSPDLILLETLSLVRSSTRPTTQLLDRLGYRSRVVDFGFSSSPICSASAANRSTAWKSGATPTIYDWATPTSWWPICWRSRTRAWSESYDCAFR